MSVGPAAAGGTDRGPAATVASPAEPPADQSATRRRVAHDPARSGSLRLFVVHADEDAWFVEGFLLEALRLPKGEVLVSSQLEPGAVVVQELARGAVSPVTVVVVSPAFLASRWAQFANDLALHQSIDAANDGSATLVPVILADCDVPLLSRFREPLDFRKQGSAHWEAEAAKLRKRIAAPAPAVTVLPCPYPGIRPFTTEDAARFHGRDKEVRDLLGRLRDGQRELYVIGPSGSGKSSLVAAGLVPSLARSPELAGGSFLVRRMRPGADPTVALATALEATATERSDPAMHWLGDTVGRLLASHPAHQRLLIFIDQLEELFTTAGATPRAAFIAAIRVLRGDARVALVFTLRADFYASLMESALWTDLDGHLSRLDVGPLRGDKLRIAIEAPAQALGVYLEPVLVERLLHDVADEPGALPLLQDTLLDLWHHRARGLLRLAEYDAMSDGAQTGLVVTLARRANGALNDLSPARRQIARRVLLRLVQFGDGTATTRRQQTRAALATVGDAPKDLDAVIRHLTDRRLVTTSGDDDVTASVRVDLAHKGLAVARASAKRVDSQAGREALVDLSHEALITGWPDFRRWIGERSADEQRRRRLEGKVGEWIERGRGTASLLDAVELVEAVQWIKSEAARELGHPAGLAELVSASKAVHTRQRRRRRGLIGGIFAALVVVAGVVVVLALAARNEANNAREQASNARDQEKNAREQTSRAEASDRESRQRLATISQSFAERGRQLVVEGHFQEAVPYLLAARRNGIDVVPLKMLKMMFSAASRHLPLVPALEHQARVVSAAFSPDGTRVVTASSDGTARVWDAASGTPVTRPLVHQAAVMSAAFSPDGTRVVTASGDKTARMWDAATGTPLTRPLEHQAAVVSAAFSPDGTRVVTASWDMTARVWDAATGTPVTHPLEHQSVVWSAAFSPDGTRVVTASLDMTARVWDAVTGTPVTRLEHQADVVSAAFSPDGTRVVTASLDMTARVWDAVTGMPVTPPLAHHARVESASFCPDGTRVVTASDDNTALVWDAATGTPVTPPLAHHGWVTSAAFSSDGTRVVTASDDNTALVWDAATGMPVTSPLVHQAAVSHAAFSPDGTRVVTASEDNTARVWNAATGTPVTRPLEHKARVESAAFSPDGTRVVTASRDKTARVWDAATGTPITLPLEHQAAVVSAAFSPDGTRVVTASWDETARVWDAATGSSLTRPLEHHGWVTSAAFSPDGTRVVTASYDKTARVWDAATGKPVTSPLVHQAAVSHAAFSPDGTRVVTASEDNTARVWDTATGTPVTPPLEHHGRVTSAAFSPDSTRVVTASEDKTARVWDAATGTPVTRPLEHQGVVFSAAFSPDGTRVATASLDKTARVWDAATGTPVTRPLEHQATVVSAAFSPDGTRVVTASGDKTARVWDAATGTPVTHALEHQAEVHSATFSPDGTRIATASEDKTARIWDVQLDEGTLERWAAVAERSPFVLDGIALVRRAPRRRSKPAD